MLFLNSTFMSVLLFLLDGAKSCERWTFRYGRPERSNVAALIFVIGHTQGIIMFLQSLPTQGWGDHEIEMLLSEAFVHYSTWHNAQSHFLGK